MNTPHSFRKTDKWIITPSSEYAVREAELPSEYAFMLIIGMPIFPFQYRTS
ncbi:hypothetical protein SXCC_04878 [Gluconacetobacter sp. SXCC-1]|nr:hypothetical protein SXCC_04878 [Gluconacetobacter sp. SXCC-1]